MPANHATRVTTARNFDAAWGRIVDELARRGVLDALGATDALLAAGRRPAPASAPAPAPAPAIASAQTGAPPGAR